MADSLEVTSLDQFVGQPKTVKILGILTKAAKRRGGCVPSILLSGPPGLGKSSLARCVSSAMGSRLIEIVAAHIQSPDELVQHLRGIREGDCLFLDELHGLSRPASEVLLGAIQDRRVPVAREGYDKLMKQLGMKTKQSTVEMVEMPPWTCIGATTMAGLLSDPLRSRFPVALVLEPYSIDDLTAIVLNASGRMGFPIAAEAATGIARRSRETARVALGFLRFFAEYIQATDELDACFELQDVDEMGLRKLDRAYLGCLLDAGCPLGLSTIASSINESPETVAQSIEPFLMRHGLLRKTPRGRVALPRAAEWIGQAA